MILYHGGLEIVTQPKILGSNRPLDFGNGFYTTTNLQQAQRWVKYAWSNKTYLWDILIFMNMNR